jgi:hypothetical protein
VVRALVVALKKEPVMTTVVLGVGKKVGSHVTVRALVSGT